MSDRTSALRGPIAWMAAHPVAANLLMIAFIIGGLMIGRSVKQEVFPEFTLDIVSISVPYPGASPAEVEQGILLAIEEAVRGLDDIKKVTATAREGVGSVGVELITGADGNKALQDIKNAIDRITSFPDEAERPQVNLVADRREVISLVLYGDLEESFLRKLAENVREELLQSKNMTNIDLAGVRPLEIGIEVPQEELRAYGLTLQDVANRVRAGSIELPAGGVKTSAGEILLRTAERRDLGSEFAEIPVVTRPDGTQVRLGAIAEINDGFRDTDQAAFFNGKRAIQVRVFRIGDQKPIKIAEEVKLYAADLRLRLPAEVGIATWNDASEMYRDRIFLLVKNAGLGLVLVLIILGVFLQIRLAFWVTMGIPISILGAFLIFPTFDVSINMISLFAFIITLGIVVDDAVVVGENIYEWRQQGLSYLEAAVRGAREVAIPVTFSILTNIAAFAPMLFVPGISGKFFRVIPIITISVFIVSLVESLFVLPAHLAHQRKRSMDQRRSAYRRWQLAFGRGLERFTKQVYQPLVLRAISWRYVTISLALGMLMLTFGYIASGRLAFTFLPKVDTDLLIVTASLPFGAPVEETNEVGERLVKSAYEVLDEYGGESLSRGVFLNVGSGFSENGLPPSGGHLVSVFLNLVPSEKRTFTASEFARDWRKQVGDVRGLDSLEFRYSTGPSAGKAIAIELSHSDVETLESAASDLAEEIATYAGVKDVDDGFSQGKPQLDFTIRPEARVLGLTATDLAAQLRNAFYGQRAFRQQRGREEIWVMVRLPEAERQSEFDIGSFIVRTPNGAEMPLAEAAEITRGFSFTEITRVDGRQVVTVTADINEGEANATQVTNDFRASFEAGLIAKYPGLQVALEGEQREQQETLNSLKVGTIFAMIVIFSMLAIPFRSYLQPAIVMSAIPFGVVGAVAGHLIMGYDLSLISMMGIVALAGVVVNDSLVLIHMANEYRRQGGPALEAIVQGGLRRFRPILLTSLTTFFGLAPMIFETSVQARFLIPMAISLGFGILFATGIILLLVPALYMILEDIRGFFLLEKTPIESGVGAAQPQLQE